MTFSSTQLPKPDNWQDFERNTKILFISVLNDPSTQSNGRSGQKQNGVDVYGQRDGNHWVGVQCKQKWDGAVTETELRAEVTKAKEFLPTIKEFILITTAPRDQSIQTVARQIQEEIKNDPVSFKISVWGWEDVCEHVNRFDEVRRSFDPTWSSSAEKNLELTESVASAVDALSLEQGSKIDRLLSIAEANSDDSNTALIGQIKAYHAMHESGDNRTALKSLTELKIQCWGNATATEKYRLLVAIGSCYIGLGQNQLAGDNLKEAYSICASHEKATSNLATAHLLHREEVSAQQLASEILRNEPDNTHAATILIQARTEGDLEKLLNDIPEPLLSDTSVVVAQIYVYRMRDDTRWKTMAREAYHRCKNDLKEPDHLPWLFAEAIVDSLFSGGEILLSGKLGDIPTDERNEAIDILIKRANHALLQGAILAPTLANNACVGLRLVDRLDEAEELATRASEMNPDDNALRLQRALIVLQKEDFAAVLNILPNTIDDPQLIPIRAAALYETGDLEGALSLLSSTDFTGEPLSNQSVALEIEFKATLSLLGHDAATEFISKLDSIIKLQPNALRFQNLRIRFFRLLGNTEESIRHLELLSQQFKSDSDPIDRAETGFEAELLFRNDIVVQVLFGHVSLDEETPQLRTLIGALFDTENFTQLHELLRSLNTDFSRSKLFLRTSAKLAIDSGAPDAEQKLSDYIEVEPNDAMVLLAQIATWQSNNKTNKIANSIRAIDFSALVGSAESRMRLCVIGCNNGRLEDSISEGHRILMLNWANPTIHTQYAGLILMMGNQQSNVFIDCTEVRVGTAISVVSDSETNRYRIEEKTESAFSSEQISPDSDMAQLLLGRKVGEEFSSGQGLRERSYRIESIKPIYVDSLHRSFREMEHRFPTYQGNLMLSMNAESEDGLDDLRDLLQEQQDYQNSLLNLYRDSTLPLTVCAAKSGNDVQEYRAGLCENGIRFRICSGTDIERRVASYNIRRNLKSGCVVDALTAHLIYALRIQHYVEAVCGPIHIAQSTLDSFASRSLHFDYADRRSQGRMYMHEGKPAIVEIPDEQLKQASEFRKKEWDWVRDETTVTAVIPDTDIPAELRKLEAAVGVRLFDSAIIARSNNLLLISEDKEYREICSGLMKTRGTWLQPILDIAFNQGKMPKSRYCEAITDIALSGVSFYAINADCLLFQAERDRFVLSADFQKLLYFLGAPDAVIKRSIDVASHFLKMLWAATIPLAEKCQYASAIFESLTKHRMESQVQILNEILKASCTYGFGIVDLNKHARSWLSGHSIGC